MDSVRIGQWIASAEGQDGFTLEEGALDEWTSGVDVRRDRVARPQAHGSFDLPGFLDSRVLPVSGLCFASSAERLNWFGSQLTGLLAGGESGMVTVELDGLTTYGFARLASKAQFTTLVPGSIARYQIQLWFANPRKFGESRTFSGVAGVQFKVHHFGNFAAAPVHVVSGSLSSGYSLDGPTGSFRVDVPLASGVPHTIDMATGLLSVGGSVVVGGVSVGDTWAVPAGVSVAQRLVALGSGSGSVVTTLRDTYI